MTTCATPTRLEANYWSPARCPADAPLAQDTPWVVESGSLATKTLPNGVVITATRLSGFQSQFTNGPGANSGDANALGVGLGPSGSANMEFEFTVSVPQPTTSFVFWDVDHDIGGNKREFVAVRAPHNRLVTDAIFRRVVAPFGATSPLNPDLSDTGFVTASTAGGAGQSNDQQGWLHWPTIGWGNRPSGHPDGRTSLRMQFGTSTGTPTNRGSAYDFRGPIYAEECSIIPRRAVLMRCGDEGHVWRDTETGEALTPEELDTMEPIR